MNKSIAIFAQAAASEQSASERLGSYNKSLFYVENIRNDIKKEVFMSRYKVFLQGVMAGASMSGTSASSGSRSITLGFHNKSLFCVINIRTDIRKRRFS